MAKLTPSAVSASRRRIAPSGASMTALSVISSSTDSGRRPERSIAERTEPGAAGHPGRELPDEPGLLGERHEDVGEEEAAGRVLPAHERLHAGRAAVAGGDLRLVVEPELAPVDRLGELARKGEAREARAL